MQFHTSRKICFYLHEKLQFKTPFPITSKPKQNTRIQHTKQTPSRSRITNPRFRFSPPQPSTTPAVTSTPCSRPASSGAAEATRTPSTSSCTGPAPSWAPWCPSASGTSPSSRTRWSVPSSPKKSRRGRDEIGTFEEKGYIYILLFFCGLIIRRFKKPRLKWLGSVTSAHIHTYVKNVFIFWSVIWYGFCTIHEVGEKKMWRWQSPKREIV